MKLRGMGLVISVTLVFTMGGATIAACVGDDPGSPAIINTPDGSTTPVPTTTSTTPPSNQEASTATAANGAECTMDAECTSKHCVDKVCCESACSGTCEHCNDPDALGKCTAIKVGFDPDKECPSTMPLDLDAGAADAGDADPDAAALLLPDGAAPPPGDDNQCASKCDGNRACGFPSSDRTCGAVFCTSPTTQGSATCDGQGHCLYGSKECKAFICPADGANGCKNNCNANDDCQPTHYCVPGDGCKPRVPNGTKCDSPAECQSGFCENKICCNVPCSGSGLSCSAAGTCTCAECAGGGACAIWYVDKDGDGFGDKFATLGNGAKYACAAGTQSGFAQNNQDCFDDPADGVDAKNVNPNAGYHLAPYTKGAATGLWDWNCNNTTEKQYPSVKAGTTCHACDFDGRECVSVTTKCVKPVPTGHVCGLAKLSCVPSSTTITAYRETVNCGESDATLYTCGTCSSTGIQTTAAPNTPQGCK